MPILFFQTAPTNEFPVNFPLGIGDLCKIYPGNIVVVAGAKSAGKTGFLLNLVKLNMNREGRTKKDIVYMNSEMGETELRIRLELFGDPPLEKWSFTPVMRSSHWADLITPEKKIFIVDYLEVVDDFYRIAGEIKAIHEKLREGICIIAIQKDPDRDYGRGGTFSGEKSRLYVSLDQNRTKIVDAKAWRDSTRNPRGLIKNFKLIKGCNFSPCDDWHTQEDEQAKTREEEGQKDRTNGNR